MVRALPFPLSSYADDQGFLFVQLNSVQLSLIKRLLCSLDVNNWRELLSLAP